MCAIAGIVSLTGETIPHLERALTVMNDLQAHRGPDGHGCWTSDRGNAGLGHRRLSIIDIAGGSQPMQDESGNCLVFNGEIYNYLELRKELGQERFRTRSDTEVILRAYERWGEQCVDHFRGMFAFALWDRAESRLFCARDRFGIKPFHFARVGDNLYFASEAKALLPFLQSIEVDAAALRDYITFQFYLGGKTLFRGVRELPPGHIISVAAGQLTTRRYWEVFYEPDFDHTARYFHEQLAFFLEDSVRLHLRSDVAVGAALSGGLDSSILLTLAANNSKEPLRAFTGHFPGYPDLDESPYARAAAENARAHHTLVPVGAADFIDHIEQVIYHLDYPLVGPGSFPQFMVARAASNSHKVLLGGQGGDEIFGGYARYLIAYFEQCIRAAIDGTMHQGNFVVTYESIIPNLESLRQYKPLLQDFWRDGLFDGLEQRYFRLINRAGSMQDEIRWSELGPYDPLETFLEVFQGNNVGKEAYFDRMTHFDFKTLLPALLHVEDRMSMAFGIESRVPFLDHPLVQLAATMPADIKFKGGALKHALRQSLASILPEPVAARKDKMGFPVPLSDWLRHEARDFLHDLFTSPEAKTRRFIDNSAVLDGIDRGGRFDRRLWALLSLELWHRAFVDKATEFSKRAPA